ncbi:MAG: DMT family transporter [Gordonibacter sp.]
MARLMNIRSICIASVVLQTLIFGSGSAITKLAYESISPLWCLVIRFGLAAAVFAVLFGPRMVRGLKGARLGDWLPAALCMAVSYIFCNIALDLTTATNVGFLMALPVVFTPFVAALVLRQRYKLAHLPFQAAVVVGLYLLCSSGGSFSFGLGEVCALVTALSLAGALVFGERGLARMDVITVSGTQIGVTFVACLVGALLFDKPLDIAAVQPIAWGTIVFLALASTCLTFALQNMALTKLPSSTVSMLLTGEPIFTALFSWVILGETLSVIGLVGAALIIVCVVAETWIDGRTGEVPERVVEEGALVLEPAYAPAFADATTTASVALPHLSVPPPQRAFDRS